MESCNKYLSQKALRSSFLLTYDRMRRYEGKWHLERRLLFPACVLLESENEERLLKELKDFRQKGKKTTIHTQILDYRKTLEEYRSPEGVL